MRFSEVHGDDMRSPHQMQTWLHSFRGETHVRHAAFTADDIDAEAGILTKKHLETMRTSNPSKEMKAIIEKRKAAAKKLKYGDWSNDLT